MSADVTLEDGPHGALRLRLSASHRRNSLRLETVAAISRALSDDDERTVVLESDTPGVFCAGADLKVGDAERAELSDRLYALYEQVVTRPGVVVAVVDGPAVGGGAQLATSADLRIVTARGRFRWVGPGHGLAVGAWILPDLVGRAAALDLTLTSRWIDANEAVRLGLAAAVVDDAEETLVTTLAALGAGQPGALARVKRVVLRQTLDHLRDERTSNHQAWDGKVPARSPD